MTVVGCGVVGWVLHVLVLQFTILHHCSHPALPLAESAAPSGRLVVHCSKPRWAGRASQLPRRPTHPPANPAHSHPTYPPAPTLTPPPLPCSQWYATCQTCTACRCAWRSC